MDITLSELQEMASRQQQQINAQQQLLATKVAYCTIDIIYWSIFFFLLNKYVKIKVIYMFQTCMTSCLPLSTKGDIQQNAHVALCHTIEMNGNRGFPWSPSTLIKWKRAAFPVC